MDERDVPGTTRARTSLALFAAIFGFGDRSGDVRADGGERD
ncbi:hypothetical protein [Halorubellus litoreus]|uniref:Uncharacterized protein n=1 Tax=Halorubellus litoreus TaxID=755308 RepID=A0ABD5V9I2_9EURY